MAGPKSPDRATPLPIEAAVINAAAPESANTPESIKQAQENARVLRELRDAVEGGTDARTVVENAGKAGSLKLSPEEKDQLRKLKSGGEGTHVVEGIISLSDYTDVLKRAKELGKTPQEAFDKMVRDGELPKGTKLDTIKDTAADFILKSGFVEDAFPEIKGRKLADGSPDPECPGIIKADGTPDLQGQKDFVDAVFAQDPDLRDAVLRKIRPILKEARTLPDGSTKDPEVKAKEDAAKKLGTETESIFDTFKDKLDVGGVKIDQKELEAILDATGGDIGRAKDKILEKLWKAKGIDNPGEVSKYITDKDNKAQLGTQKDALQARYDAATDPAEKSALGVEIGRIDGQIANVDVQLRQFQARFAGGSAMTPAADRERAADAQAADYQSAKAQIEGFDDHGTLRGSIDGDLSTFNAKRAEQKAAQKDYEDTKAAKGTGLTPEEEAKRRELLEKAGDVMNESLRKVMETRLDQHDELSSRKMEADTKRYEETQRLNEAGMVDRLKIAMETKWVRMEGRRRRADRRQIGEDMKFLAQHGEDGLKTLVLRDMGIVQYDAQTGAPIRVTRVDQLNDVNKKAFDEIYGNHGDKYAQKLMTSYFTAPNVRGEGSRALNLRLTNSELASLYENFGDKLEGGQAQATETKKFVEKLKDKKTKLPGVVGIAGFMAALGMLAIKGRSEVS